MNTSSKPHNNTDTIRDFVAAVAEATGATVRILSRRGEEIATSGRTAPGQRTEAAASHEVSVEISHNGAMLGRLVALGGSRTGITEASLRPFAVAAGFLLSRDTTAPGEVRLQKSEAVARVSREAQDLISHEAFLEQIIENYPGILCVMEPPPDFRLVLANRRFTSMLAEPYASGEPVQGRTVREVSREWNEDSAALSDLMTKVYESGEAVSFEQYASRTPDRGTLYWNWTIVPIGGPSSPEEAPGYVLLIAHDVTDRVLARQQLQASAQVARSTAEELDGVITQMAEGVAIFDERGEIKRMNPAAEHILGRGAMKGIFPDRQGEIYGLFKSDGQPYDAESLPVSRALRGETVVGEQMIVRRPSEEEIYIRSSIAPITNGSGAITGVVGVFHDVTQETMIDRLKNEFVSIVSHELRTPLTAIMGYSDLMLRGVHGTLSDRQAKALNAVRANANRLLHLINDLLDVSKLESGKVQLNPEPVDLASMVSRTLAQTRVLAAEAGINLHNYIPQRSLPPVMAEETKVQQIVENLLTNAIKFTPAGGTITFEANLSSLEAADPALAQVEYGHAVEETLPARSVVVSVTDTGSGLAPDQLNRIWNRFYQVDATSRRRSGGAGLGLAIVRSLAELHGGLVWAESRGTGNGSTFRFSLPVGTHR